MATRFSVVSVFKAVDRVTRPVRRITASVARMSRSIERGFARANRAVSKFNGVLKKSAVLATASFISVGAAIKSVVLTGAEFGRAIGSAAAKFPDQIKRGTAAFDELKTAAREVGATTEFTATEAAKGLDFLAKAGFSASFSIKALPKIVDFATASQLDFAEAADIASDSLGAFGLDSADLGEKMAGLDRVMDVLSLAANSANADVTQLFESIKKSAPLTKVAGVSVETFGATLQFLADSGIKASEAGTATKNLILGLAGIGNKAAPALKKLGIRLADNNGDLRDQLDILDDLRTTLKPLGSKQRLGIISAIFGKISISAASKLLDESGKSVRGLRKELEQAGGSSKRTAGFIRDDVKGSLDGLSSAIEDVKIGIFDMNEGAIKEAIDLMTEWVRANNKLISTNLGGFLKDLTENFEEIVLVGKQIAGVVVLYLGLVAALKIAAGAGLLFNIVMAAGSVVMGISKGAMVAYAAVVTALPKALGLAKVAVIAFNIIAGLNPLGLVIASIATFIALAALVVAAWRPVTEFFSGLWQTIKDLVAGFGSAVEKFGKFFGFTTDIEVPEIPPIRAAIVPEFSGPSEFLGGFKRSDEFDSGPHIVSPQERAAKSVQENNTTTTSVITIRDETGKAEVTQGSLGGGVKLQTSGVF